MAIIDQLKDTLRVFEISSIDGKTKQSAVNFIYKKINPLTKGFFSDQAWEGVRTIWDAFNDLGLDWVITDNFYGARKFSGDTPHSSKTWKFEINFINKNGRKQTLYGNLIASGAGSVEDPLDRYDITVVIG